MVLKFQPYPLSLRHTFTVSGCSRNETPDVLLTLEHEGFCGFGEASMPPYLGESIESVCGFLSRLDMAQFNDPFRTDDIMDYLETIAPGNYAAKCAINIALNDLQGRICGQPLYKLWGLTPEQTVPTTFTIGIDTPEVVRQKVAETDGKYLRLKVKVGVPGDRETIDAIRQESDVPLTVDANQGWKSREEALDNIFWLKEHGVIMIEQPLPASSLDDLAWLTERSPLPVFADESVQRLDDVLKLKGVVSGINIKLMKCGGLTEARKMITVAHAMGLKIMLGCMTETQCAVTAAAQLSSQADFLDLDGNLLISNDPFIGGVKVLGGKLKLGTGPGLGIHRVR